jgi:apolipoprotein D and lipocalin family protein
MISFRILKIKPTWWILLAFIIISGCQSPKHITSELEESDKTTAEELKVVPFVDLSQYLGTWYEIARYPHSFEENCFASQANYSLRDDGYIRVINRCWIGGFDGELNEAEGKAWVVDKTTNAKLKVQFFWPFSGKYWVIALDPEYQYAVVGHPSLKYLWILNRSQKMSPRLYEKLLQEIEQQGYDTKKLIITPQPKVF